MKWEFLEDPSSNELKEFESKFKRAHGFSIRKKPKYFVDESLGERVLEVLKEMKLSGVGVWEKDLVGHPDENIFRFCQKEQRILLTFDNGFLDNNKFPIRKCFGVVILPGAEGEVNNLVDSLGDFLGVCRWAGFLYQTKIKLLKNGNWDVFCMNEDGFIHKDIYRLERGGRVSILTD